MAVIKRKEKKSRLAVVLFSLLEPITPFSLTGAVKRVFLPFWKRPMCWGVWSLITIVTFILYVQTSIAEVMTHSCMDMRIIGSELRHEVGPNWVESARDQLLTLLTFADEMDNRQLAFVAKRLYPTYDHRKLLTPLMKELNNISTDEEARQKMPDLAKKIADFCDEVDKISNSRIIWYKYDNLSPTLLREVTATLESSSVLLLDFKKDVAELLQNPERLTDKRERERIMEKARRLCMSQRRTALLLFVARLGYDDKQSMQDFRQDVEEAKDQMTALANKIRETTKNALDPNAHLLDKYAASGARRLTMLDPMIAGDMEELYKAVHNALTQSNS